MSPAALYYSPSSSWTDATAAHPGDGLSPPAFPPSPGVFADDHGSALSPGMPFSALLALSDSSDLPSVQPPPSALPTTSLASSDSPSLLSSPIPSAPFDSLITAPEAPSALPAPVRPVPAASDVEIKVIQEMKKNNHFVSVKDGTQIVSDDDVQKLWQCRAEQENELFGRVRKILLFARITESSQTLSLAELASVICILHVSENKDLTKDNTLLRVLFNPRGTPRKSDAELKEDASRLYAVIAGAVAPRELSQFAAPKPRLSPYEVVVACMATGVFHKGVNDRKPHEWKLIQDVERLPKSVVRYLGPLSRAEAEQELQRNLEKCNREARGKEEKVEAVCFLRLSGPRVVISKDLGSGQWKATPYHGALVLSYYGSRTQLTGPDGVEYRFSASHVVLRVEDDFESALHLAKHRATPLVDGPPGYLKFDSSTKRSREEAFPASANQWSTTVSF